MRKNKVQAISLRKTGLSYNQIAKRLKIPKSTLSGWLKDIQESKVIKGKNIDKAKKKWAENIVAYNKRRSEIARVEWGKIQNLSSKEIGKISRREMKLVGSALYWAEGYKRGNWNLVFCNSDPNMLRLMIIFFVKICGVPPQKMKAQVQIHHNISAQSATKYWSKILKLPPNQFLKPIYQVSRSSKLKRRNNLPFGTLRIKINDVKLVNKIKGWINGLASG
jgi:Mn-dependent DtxR family transcriptional regulator